MPDGETPRTPEIVAETEALVARIADVRAGIGRAIFGQHEAIDQTLIALLSGGHALLVGVPGLGNLVVSAVLRRDYPVIQAVTVYLAVLTMLINLATDLLYKAVDPRVVLK